MAKVGRPKKEVCRDQKIDFRLTSDEYERLVEYAQKHGVTITQVIRESIKDLIDK